MDREESCSNSDGKATGKQQQRQQHKSATA